MAIPKYPNQRSITIHKPRSEPGGFTYINTSAALEAMANLSYSTYMLYSFFNLNADISLSIAPVQPISVK